MGRSKANADATVTSFGKIEEANSSQLSFLANPKYEDYLYTTGAAIVIINESYELRQPIKATLIRVPDAYSAFAQLLSQYQEMMNSSMKGIQQPVLYCAFRPVWHRCFCRRFLLYRRRCESRQRHQDFPEHLYWRKRADW